MKIVIIVQARMGSTRLPNKVLKKINGIPMLIFQYLRLKEVKRANLICVATSIEEKDDIIVQLCLNNNIKYFRGSESNVLKRYFDAANNVNADLIVRVNSDCPLIDPFEIDKVIEKWLVNKKVDYVSNILEETFPLGMHIEVFSKKILDTAYHEAKKDDEKEHVTPYIYRNPDKFKLLSVVSKENLSHHRWTVDYEEDIEFVKSVAERLMPIKKIFQMKDIIELVDNEPNLKKINNMYTKRQNLL